MQINLLFGNIEEMVDFCFDVAQKTGNAADVNSDDSGASIPNDSITHDAQDAQDAQDIPCEKTMEDALEELGLGLSRDAHPRKLSCKNTLKKWFNVLGYEDFKNAIGAISSAWPKYYDGQQWNRSIVKDVCVFVMHCRNLGFEIDFELLAYSLSHLARGEKIITPMDMRNNISQHNSGNTTLERYNAQLGNLRKPKIPPISKKERRNIEHE